jgi:hypothetical protein
MPAIREVFAMLRSHALFLLLGAMLLCSFSVRAQRGHRNPPDIFKDEGIMPPAAHQGPDTKAMMQDAVELKQLSAGIPEEIQKTTQGTISADLGTRLKRIEKLAKKLRGEVQQ